jgi:hypothetical protein
MMIEARSDVEGGPNEEPEDDPAGGVELPRTRPALARAYALAGIALGANTIVAMLTNWDTSSVTGISV